MLDIKSLIKVRVFQLLHLNQFVIELENNNNFYKAFQSYNSYICLYDITNKKLYLNWTKWDYSKTTLKHFKEFINRYTHYEYINKAQFEKLIYNDSTIELFNYR